MGFEFMDIIRAERKLAANGKVISRLTTKRKLEEDAKGYDPKSTSEADRKHGAHFKPISKALTRPLPEAEMEYVARQWELILASVIAYRAKCAEIEEARQVRLRDDEDMRLVWEQLAEAYDWQHQQRRGWEQRDWVHVYLWRNLDTMYWIQEVCHEPATQGYS